MMFCVGEFSYASLNIDEINFKKVSGELSESSVSKIIEDTYGFMWIGTSNGIVKYDGNSFKKFDSNYDDYFVKGYVSEIHQGKSGTIYIGTHRGINYYDRALDELKRFKFYDENSFLNNCSITKILETPNYLWIGTSRKGLFRYNLKTSVVKKIDFINSQKLFNDVLNISKLNDHTYVIVNRHGVYVIDEDMSILNSRDLNSVKTVKKVTPNKFLLGSFTGYLSTLVINEDLRIVEKDKQKFTDFRIASIEIDEQNNVWIAAENDGVYILNDKNKTILHLLNSTKTPELLPNNSIWSIYKAKNGVIWLGSFKKGISYNNFKNLKFIHEKSQKSLKNSLSNNIVNSFLEDKDGNIWIGTDGGGLNYWDRSLGMFYHIPIGNSKFTVKAVLSIIKKDNKLWLATWANGVIVYDLENKTFNQFNSVNSSLTSNFIQDVFLDSSGKIWIGTFKGGIYIFDDDKKDFDKVDIIVDGKLVNLYNTTKIYEDENHNFWVASDGDGIILLMPTGNNKFTAKQYLEDGTKHKSIYFDFVNVVFQDTEGKIWVGTNYGLGIYDSKNDKFEKILNHKQLKNLYVESIEQDNNNCLWIGTSEGLIQFDPKNNKVLTYSVEDGVQGNNFNPSATYKTSKGELVFGGSNGFNIFFPDKVEKRQDVPSLYISKLKIQNQQVFANDKFGVLKKDISQLDTLTLSYTHNVINFEFAAITYSNIKGVEYAYYLEGFDKKWNFIGNKNDVTYTNLDPGEYKLHVKSTNSDGIWVDNGKVILINIIPPFWKTLWFKLVVIGLCIVVICLMLYTRNKRIKDTQRLLKKEIADRTKELEQQTNKFISIADELSLKNEEIQRFAFSVSHDLKSPLGNIKTLAELIQIEFSEKELPLIENYIEMIETSCETMNNLIEDITGVARLGKIQNKKEVLDTNKIVRLSKKIINAKFREHNVDLVVKNELPVIFVDRNRFIQVFSNLFDNSIKYRGNQQKPIITIESEETDTSTIIKITDNGSGVNSRHMPKLFTPFERFHSGTKGTGLGLYMIKQIILSHDGTITAFSEGDNKGTTFKIVLPKYQK